MDDLLSEKEQIEQIRSWWSDYGNYVIGGVVAGALILFGINYYQNSKLNTQLAASALFEQLAVHVADGELEDAEAIAADLTVAYANTTYAAQSKLAMARLYMEKNRDQDAADVLNELMVSKGDEYLKDIGRLRLARIYLYQDKAQEVVDLLEGFEDSAFSARYAEVLGDAYAVLGQVADAEAAYQTALGDADASQSIDRALVQWKILDLPKVEDEPAGTDDVGAEAAPRSDDAPAADSGDVGAVVTPRSEDEPATDNE
ncbi:MAG: tetratricopeptide repeat protein [Woeseiaceae bacterium]|nr:tetratricopeptide repeat protein [Woeseiaceae bacterium]